MYSKVYCRTEFSVDTVTLMSVSCTGKKTPYQKEWLCTGYPVPVFPKTKRFFPRFSGEGRMMLLMPSTGVMQAANVYFSSSVLAPKSNNKFQFSSRVSVS